MTLVVFVSVFLVPWWGALLATLVLVAWFAPYYEAVLIGLVLDTLYVLHTSETFLFGFPFTLVFVVGLFASLYVKDKVRLAV